MGGGGGGGKYVPPTSDPVICYSHCKKMIVTIVTV